jgi:hypothetical protein
MAAKLGPETNEIRAESEVKMNFTKRSVGYARLYCKMDLDIVKELNT